MTKREFIKVCGVLGIGLPFASILVGCDDDAPTSKGNFQGTTIIIGAE